MSRTICVSGAILGLPTSSVGSNVWSANLQVGSKEGWSANLQVGSEFGLLTSRLAVKMDGLPTSRLAVSLVYQPPGWQ